jgi:hypothetical protein
MVLETSLTQFLMASSKLFSEEAMTSITFTIGMVLIFGEGITTKGSQIVSDSGYN